MKKFLAMFMLALALLIPGCQKQPGNQAGVVEKKVSKNYQQPYYVFRPDAYTPKMPLVVAVPGGGEDEAALLELLKPLAIKDDFVLAVQSFPSGFSGFKNKEDLKFIGMVQDLKDSLGIDFSNIYLLGFGEGGTFVQKIALMYPALVKSAVLIDTPAFYPADRLANSVRFLLLADTPTRAENEKFLKNLKEQGFKAEMKKFPEEQSAISLDAGREAFAFFVKTMKEAAQAKPAPKDSRQGQEPAPEAAKEK